MIIKFIEWITIKLVELQLANLHCINKVTHELYIMRLNEFDKDMQTINQFPALHKVKFFVAMLSSLVHHEFCN
jgi:hypothetical protein